MGAIRGVLLVIVSVLLFLSLFLMNLSFILNTSLTYDNVQTESKLLINEALQNPANITSYILQGEADKISALNKSYVSIMTYCLQNHTEYILSSQNYTANLSCETVLNGKEILIEKEIDKDISTFYYTKYDCGFIECFRKYSSPIFLISEEVSYYWEEKFYFFLAVSIALLALAFIFIEKKTNLPILAGSLLAVSSLPLLKLDSLFSLFSGKTLASIAKFLKIFFSQSYVVSLKLLIIGISIIIFGIILKVFKVGFFISKIISKFKDLKKNLTSKKKDKKESPKKEDEKPSDSKSK